MKIGAYFVFNEALNVVEPKERVCLCCQGPVGIGDYFFQKFDKRKKENVCDVEYYLCKECQKTQLIQYFWSKKEYGSLECSHYEIDLTEKGPFDCF